MCSTALAHRGWLCKSTKWQKIGCSRLPISNAPTDVGFPDPFLIISAKADATKAERVSSRCHSASPPGLSVGDVPAETRSGASPAGSTGQVRLARACGLSPGRKNTSHDRLARRNSNRTSRVL